MGDNDNRPNQHEHADREREFETGMDERFKHVSGDLADAWAANRKNTYDNLISTQQKLQEMYERTVAQANIQIANINAVTLQHLQNAVTAANQVNQNTIETANLTGKQAVRHGDIAIDGQWNPVQQGAGDTLTARAVSIDDASLKAIGAALAAAIAQALNPAK